MTLPPYPGSGESPEDRPDDRPDHGEAPDEQGHQPTPPYGQPAAPSPYGQPAPPYGGYPQQPYGQAPYGQAPYGQAPYGGQPGQPPYGGYGAPGGYGAYQGYNDATGQSYSGVAIAALVLSFTCVLSFVGVILGIVGLFRTGPTKGKGRWMAVTGIVVGTLFTALFAAIAGLGLWFGQQVVTPGNAEAGQCVTTDTDDDEVFMWKVDCDDPHDAEIVGRHQVTAPEARRGFDAAWQVCDRMLRENFPGSFADVDESLDLRILTEHRTLEAGEPLVCYIERRDGASMKEQVLD